MSHHALLVVQKSPCTACVISNNLDLETLRKVAAARSDFTYEVVEINHPREVWSVPGLEVEHLPAVILDGEQIAAGNIISPRLIAQILAARGDNACVL